MKKTIVGLCLVAAITLAGCSQNDENDNTQVSSSEASTASSTKETTTSSTESSSTPVGSKVFTDAEREEILAKVSTDQNIKMTEAFLDNGLEMYDNDAVGPYEWDAIVQDADNGYPDTTSSLFFLIEESREGPTIMIDNFENEADIDTAIAWYAEQGRDDLVLTANRSLKSLMKTTPSEFVGASEGKDADYISVFESIK